MAGSMSPLRVPITSPSSGVMPMEWSTALPPATAVIEQPLPRCTVMRLTRSAGLPSSLAAASVT